MQFLQDSIPEMILRNVVELLQPFSPDTITPDDVQAALLQYDRPMLTVAEFAERTRRSKKSVYRLIEKQQLEVYKNGNTYLIPETEISRICVKLNGGEQ